jgi:hypothetical protein
MSDVQDVETTIREYNCFTRVLVPHIRGLGSIQNLSHRHFRFFELQ